MNLSKVSSKLVVTKQVKDRSDPNGGTKTKGYIPVVSFFVTGSMSMLEGCGITKDTNAIKAHPILW
jgi:hypothetical protein